MHLPLTHQVIDRVSIAFTAVFGLSRPDCQGESNHAFAFSCVPIVVRITRHDIIGAGVEPR